MMKRYYDSATPSRATHRCCRCSALWMVSCDAEYGLCWTLITPRLKRSNCCDPPYGSVRGTMERMMRPLKPEFADLPFQLETEWALLQTGHGEAV